MSTAQRWNDLISDALETTDPLLSNFKITRVHYLLSCGLRHAVGREAGANFHSWAVWGSRKAGVTIRQEDKDQAARDATVVAGVVGAIVGLGTGWLCGVMFNWSLVWSLLAWAALGVVSGGYCGFLLALYTRRAAARLILAGNRTVLDDIGRETARYLEYVDTAGEAKDRAKHFRAFLAGFRPGPSEAGGQGLLKDAFEQYEKARLADALKVQHESNYFANCLAVLHEHIRLQPYISQSLPLLIRKCVTQRLMTYSVGEKQLAVHEDVPPLKDAQFPQTLAVLDSRELRDFLEGSGGWDVGRGSLDNTRARDWTIIRERMGYIVNLFRTRHTHADVVASPYTAPQMQRIAAGELPPRPW